MKTGNGGSLDTATILRREMFDRLPEHIREAATNLAVKQMHVEVMARRLEDEHAALQARRNDLELATIDLDTLKCELRDMCREWVSKNNM